MSGGTTARKEARHELGRLFEETVSLYLRLKSSANTIYGRGDLSGPRRTVLLAIAREGPLTVPHLARQRAESRQRLQPLVNALVQEGLLALASNPAHKRSPLLVLTNRGQQMAKTIVERESALRSQLKVDVSPRRLAEAADVLRAIRQVLGSSETIDTLKRGRV